MGLVPLESYVSPLSLSTHGFLDKSILEVANLRKVSRDCKNQQIWDPWIPDLRIFGISGESEQAPISRMRNPSKLYILTFAMLPLKNVPCNYGGNPSRTVGSWCLTVPELEVGPRYHGS